MTFRFCSAGWDLVGEELRDRLRVSFPPCCYCHRGITRPCHFPRQTLRREGRGGRLRATYHSFMPERGL
ncbi:hypothetical protein MCOR14_000540 [Pyricularia oryzae]|nr:hypothetical protein MCOR32_006477 [Pyricularia oryzae]KAI6488345.1 hypothetical protein MCOR11_008473 [Pyricularia oryzae]KAI6645094.1 hypothetical protein MCOR14_000540 [Pyricularia oryzae]